MDKNINQPDFPHTGDAFERFDKQRVFDGMTSFEIWEHGVLWADRTNPKSSEQPAEAPASSGHTPGPMKWGTENESLQHARAETKKWETKFNECFDLWVKSSNEIESLSKELQEARALLKESLMEIQTGYGLAGLTGPKADPKGLVKRITDNLKDR
jgi:hypothetical protein